MAEAKMPLAFNAFVLKFKPDLQRCAARHDVANRSIIVRSTDGMKVTYKGMGYDQGHEACVKFFNEWRKKHPR